MSSSWKDSCKEPFVVPKLLPMSPVLHHKSSATHTAFDESMLLLRDPLKQEN